METKEAISTIKEILTEADKNGDRQFKKSEIIKLLDIVEKQASDSLVLRESRYKAILEADMEVFRSVFVYGQAALKSTILINGGAAIAILAFLARYLSTNAAVVEFQSFLYSMATFGLGVFIGAFTTGFTYLTQFFFAKKRDSLGTTFQVISIVFGISSLICFGIGIWLTYCGFKVAFGT